MMTKKLLLCALSAFALTACSDDDDDKTPNPGTIETSEGVFVVNQGQMSQNIPGSLTYIDYKTGTAEQNAFKNVNGIVLGDTPYGALVHGSKLYIAVQESNVIQVIDRHTLKSIKMIKPESNQGSHPKQLAAKDGYVYVGMFGDGYVARIDTLSLTIDKSVKVGPNPEGIAIAGNYIYSADSDGMNWQNGYGKTVSKINLTTFEVEKTIEVGLNPTNMVSNGKDVIVACMGNYSTIDPELKRIKADDSVESVGNGTYIAIKDNNLYTIFSSYVPVMDENGNPVEYEDGTVKMKDTEYWIYNLSDGTRSTMVSEPVASPTALAVDPVSGKIFIGSTNGDPMNGWKMPGYINEYSADGTFVKKYDTGVSPAVFAFNVTEAK